MVYSHIVWKPPIMIQVNKVIELSSKWTKLGFSKISKLETNHLKLAIEFVVDVSDKRSSRLLAILQEHTIKKHPAGNVSFIGYWSPNNQPAGTQYRKYRIDFVDESIKMGVDEDRESSYFEKLIELIGNYEKTEPEKIQTAINPKSKTSLRRGKA